MKLSIIHGYKGKLGIKGKCRASDGDEGEI